MNIGQVIVLSVLQGVTELFPLSSLGHTVIVPALFNWTNVDRTAPQYLAFVVLLHLGTAGALLTFYWREWIALIKAFFASLVRGKLEGPQERFVWLLFAGTIPAGILAVLFEKELRDNFANAKAAALFLIVNAGIMMAGEILRRRQEPKTSHNQTIFDGSSDLKTIDKLSFPGAVFIGFAQSLALLPGFSRSGSTIVAGLLLKLKHGDAAHFSFMLATPIILAAGVKTLPDLLAPAARSFLPMALLGGIIAGICAYLSVRFLERYFQKNRLDPFAIYCAVFGLGSFIILSVR